MGIATKLTTFKEIIDFQESYCRLRPNQVVIEILTVC